jgi:hypothetical protein
MTLLKTKIMGIFTLGKEVNITGLVNKSIISIQYHVLENAFGQPTIIEDNNYAIWKLKFEDTEESIAILNDNENYLETTKWIVKAGNLRSLNRVKNILASI